MVLYHGSPELFTAFDLSKAGEGTGVKFGFGVYLTESEASAVQSEAFRVELERSKGLYIVEDETGRPGCKKSADAYGTIRVGDEMVGPNILGQFLMELRDTGKLDYTLPDDALHFIEHLKE